MGQQPNRTFAYAVPNPWPWSSPWIKFQLKVRAPTKLRCDSFIYGRLASQKPHWRWITRLVQELPSFFVVGPPRTGTSWLHEVLWNHATLPNLKETRFFDLHFELGLEWYLRHFSGRKTKIPIGEIAPTYFSSTDARSRIANLVPGARVVCIFRNPIERIVSLYKLKRSLGIIPWSFEEALFRDKELLESSKYATNLQGWQQSLGEKQVLPTVYDDLRDNPQSFIDRIADFIGISRFTLPSASMRRVHTSERLTQPRWHIITQNGTRLAQWLKTKRLYRLGRVFVPP